MIKRTANPDHTTSTPKLLGHRELSQSRGGTTGAQPQNTTPVDSPKGSW